MPIKKGEILNPAGRALGSKNKTPTGLRGKYEKFLQLSFKDIQKEYKKLPIAEKIKLHNAIANLTMPKLSAVKSETLSETKNSPVTFTLDLGDAPTALPEGIQLLALPEPEQAYIPSIKEERPYRAIPIEPEKQNQNTSAWDSYLL